jgi:hypothetical protein
MTRSSAGVDGTRSRSIAAGKTGRFPMTIWRNSIRPTPWLALFLACLIGTSAGAEEGGSAQALTDRMLERLGGRDAWARLRNTINGSQQNRAGEPTVVYSIISMDFERPRFRIETTGPDLHLIRVVDGEDSWRLSRAGQIEALPADRFEGDMSWYGAHVYRTIHRLAARDSALSVGLADDGRLQVFEGDRRLLWLRLDAKAEPYAFGFYDDENGSLSGPWDVIADGVHQPRWVSSPDGTWRAYIKSVEFNVPLHDSVFVRPGS